MGFGSLEDLIERTPDPELDRVTLLRAKNSTPAVARLANSLHTRATWRQTPLGVLLPGLDQIDGPGGSFPPPLTVRGTNCLLRARIESWRALSGWTPAEIGNLDGLGSISLEEILRATIREWAGFQFGDRTSQLGDRASLNPSEIYDGLVALSAWGASTRGTRGAVAAIEAASDAREELPQPVARAMRALRRIGGSEEESSYGLKDAFVEVEAAPEFSVFKRRQLEDRALRPTLVELAGELGVSKNRVGHIETSFKRKLARRMQEKDWPIRHAAEQLREILGAVARSEELDGAFAELDRNDTFAPGAHDHRRALLLWLCDYRTDQDWILGPDIEGLTDVILAAVAKSKHADLEAATRQLTLLGVREEMQLGWILSRVGYRIVDSRIVPAG